MHFIWNLLSHFFAKWNWYPYKQKLNFIIKLWKIIVQIEKPIQFYKMYFNVRIHNHKPNADPRSLM